MALDPAYFFYSDGTITLTNGSDIATGDMVFWDTAVLPFDTLYANDGQNGVTVIKEVLSVNQLRLAKPWTGPTLTNVPYFVLRWVRHTDPRVYAVRVSEYLTRLKAIPDNIEQVAAEIHADRQAIDAAMVTLQQIELSVNADREAAEAAAGSAQGAATAAADSADEARQWAEAASSGVLPDNGVTNAKLADMPAGTVKANLSGSTADPSDVTLADLKAAMDLDIPLLPQDASPFGLANMRILLGELEDAHYGFNSGILDAGNGKWVVVYRKASNHTVTNGSEIRAFDTYDKGATRVNDRLIYTDPNYDTRNFVAGVMGNGRLGIICSRRQAGNLTYTNGIFIYSDDKGVTWNTVTVNAPSAGFGINFHGNLNQYPASVGGDDTNGFIAYSYSGTTGNIDAVRTTDNGATWTWSTGIAAPVAPATSLNEMAVVRVGTQNKWLMYARVSGQDNAVVFTSTSMLTWSAQADTGLHLEGNPPQALYDPATNKIWFIGFFRRDRGLYSSPSSTGLESYMTLASADADALWTAGGRFGTLGIGWTPFSAIPNWASGYLHPFRIDGRWYATFVAGEDWENHAYSKLFLLGDFLATGADMLSVARQFVRNPEADFGFFRKLQVGFGVAQPTQRGHLTVGLDSATPALVTEVFSANLRQVAAFRNTNGVVGSISVSGTTTTYATTSDVRVKPIRKPIENSGAIIDAVVPIYHNWLTSSDEWSYSFPAQELAKHLPQAVLRGDDDPDKRPGNEGFEAWLVDPGKVVPVLWAEVRELRLRLAALEAKEEV